MAKYNVKFSCGHEETIDLFGPVKERESKIAYFEKRGLCRECYEKEQNANCDVVEMPYSEYKNKYANCKTKANSYDKAKKTIIVYVPKTTSEVKLETGNIEDRKEAIKKVAEETGYPYEVLEKQFIFLTAERFKSAIDKYADVYKSNNDASGKYATAYDAAIALYNVAKKYGL